MGITDLPTRRRRPRRPGPFSLLSSQVSYQVRVLVRTPIGSFFVFVIPVMLLLALNLLNSSVRLPSRGGIRFADFFTPATAAFAVINACFINVVTSTTHSRDSGILKRFRTTPLPPWIYLMARLAAAALVTLLSVSTVFALGIGVFGVDVPWASLAASAFVVVTGILCFCALGFAITIVIPNSDAAVPVAYGMVLPLCFVSDVFLPIDAAPRWLRTMGSVFPIEHLARPLEDLWYPDVSAAGVRLGARCRPRCMGSGSLRAGAAMVPVGAARNGRPPSAVEPSL